jgi:hypothetical protein
MARFEFPATSQALTSIRLVPVARGISAMDQMVVPVAVPLPPRSLRQVTRATLTLSQALPARPSRSEFVIKVLRAVGELMTM